MLKTLKLLKSQNHLFTGFQDKVMVTNIQRFFDSNTEVILNKNLMKIISS